MSSTSNGARQPARRTNGLTLVLHNLPAGDWGRGERGIACHPDRVAEFRTGVERAIDYATALACPKVNCLAGILPERRHGRDARARRLIDNLRYAAGKLAGRRDRAAARAGQQPRHSRASSSTARAGARHHRGNRLEATSSCSTTSTMRR